MFEFPGVPNLDKSRTRFAFASFQADSPIANTMVMRNGTLH